MRGVELSIKILVTAIQSHLRLHWRTAVLFLAIFTDVAVVALSHAASGFLLPRFGFVLVPDAERIALLAFSLFTMLILHTTIGLYRNISYVSLPHQLLEAGKAYLYSIATIATVTFVFHDVTAWRQALLVFFLVYPVSYLLVWGGMRIWLQALRRRGLGIANTLAVGSQPYLGSLLERVQDNPQLGYRISGVIVAAESARDDGMLQVERSTVEGLVYRNNVDIIALSSSKLNGAYDELEEICRSRNITMRLLSPESDGLFSRAGVKDIAGIPLFSPERPRIDWLRGLLKRLFDIVFSSVLLVLSAPVFLIVAIGTRVESAGPAFFRQWRALTDVDEPFQFLKFRSMIHEADEQREALTEKNDTGGVLFKIKNDPRLTQIGRFIRRHSIDELPQLVNVLKGEMSLVGPRPLPARDLARVQEEDHMGGFFRQRARVKPGMTGLWQISGRSDLGFREMVLLDLYYIEHQSLLLDIEILARTIPVVLLGKGAY